MAITRRGNGWQAAYRGPDGRERTRTFRRKSDAEKWLDTNRADIARGQWIDPRAGRTTFASWVQEWRGTTANLRPSTRSRDLGYVDRYLLPTFGRVALADVSHMMVARWLAEMTSTGPAPWWDTGEEPDRERRKLSPATATKAAQLLSKIMASAVRARKVLVNPVDGVPLPRVEREEMRFLTPSEVAKLTEAIDPRYRALVLLGAYGGLRIGEMAGLRRSRVDILRSRVRVAEVSVEVEGHLHFGPPKTKAAKRNVALPRSVTAAMDEHLAGLTAPEPDAMVFTAPEGGPLRVPAWRRRVWRPAVTAAGFDPLRPHDLRHTAVALWIAAGANPLEVSRRAGHTSTSFTLDRYGHLFPDADSSVADRLEGVFVGTSDEGSATDFVGSRGHLADKSTAAAS